MVEELRMDELEGLIERDQKTGKRYYDDDFVSLTATMFGIAGSIAGKNEATTTKKDGLKRVLEEFEKGNDVHISDVINFIHELSSTDSETDEEIKENIKQKINLEEGNEYLNANQCMEFLANELQIDPEEEVLKAFRVFDKDNTGAISLSELKSIMEERGNTLNDEEIKLIVECSRQYEIHEEAEKEHEDEEDDEDVKIIIKGKGGKGTKVPKEGKGSKVPKEGKGSKAPKEGKRKVSKEVRASKVPKETKTSKVVKEVKEGPKDVKVDYRKFVKGLMEKINQNETKLWGAKE